MKSVLERFWEKVDVRGPDECWPFHGTRNNVGYCDFHIGGDTRRGPRYRESAHRFSWELHNTVPIPAGKVIDHICKNTVCVNPAHLRPVTQVENCTVLARPTPFYRNMLATACPKGHPYVGEANVARIIKWDRRVRGWRATRICLVCRPGFRNHPRRFYLFEDFPDLQQAAA